MRSNNFKIQNPPVVGWRQVLCITPPPPPRQSPKENKLKLWPKIYVLQCTLYARMNVHLGLKNFFHRCSKTILNSTWLSHHLHCRLPSERDGLGILICSCITCRKISDLRKVVYRRIQILMVAAILFRWHSDWSLHAARAVPIECFNRGITQPLRSDSRRAYRPQPFFKYLSLTATIKLNKNKSRSY